MKDRNESHSRDKVGRALIKAFVFAGAILGVGAFGLVRTIVLLGVDMGWFKDSPQLGSGYWWLGGGAGLGLVAGWMLVKARPRG